MKNLILVALISVPAHQAMAMGFECVSDAPYKLGGRLTFSTGGVLETLTVEFNGRLIYRSVPVVSDFAKDVNTYRSPGFKNKNNAPANLFAQVYRKNRKLLFKFNEGSYLPVVPVLGGECRPTE